MRRRIFQHWRITWSILKSQSIQIISLRKVFIWESVKFKLTRSVSLCIIFSDVSVNVLLDDWWCWRCISVKWWAPQEPLLHFSNSLLWLQVSRSWMLSTVGWLTSDSRNISPCSPRLGMIWTQSPECKY